MATKHNSSITEKRIESPKLPIIISTLAILISSIAVIVSLSIGGYDFIYFLFPILLLVCDAVFIVLTLFSNYRFRYSIPFPTAYLILTVALTVVTVLTDGGSNGTHLFTHFAIYFFLSLHLFAAVAVALGYMNAAKVGKKPAVIRNISTVTALLLVVATCVYSYTVFYSGWFGQGAVGVHRPLQYTYDSETDGYKVVGVLSGRGDTVSVPETFNDKPVTGVDCSIFETEFIRNIYIRADLKYEDLENKHLLWSGGERTIYAKNFENIRQGFFDEAVSTESEVSIHIANAIVPADLEDGKVYVTFTYDLDDLIAVKGEVIPVWIGDAGDTIGLDFLKEIGYIAHALEDENYDANHWSYANIGRRIFSGINGVEKGKGLDNIKVNASATNYKVEFEDLYKIAVAEDNDTVHAEPDAFKFYEYEGTAVDNVLTLSEATEWFDTYESRSGFDIDWYVNSASGAHFDAIEDVVVDGMTIVPVWTMKAPTITDIKNHNKYDSNRPNLIYGQDVTFNNESTLAYAGFNISYEWRYNDSLVSTEKTFDLANVRPSQSGTYTLTVTSHNDSISSLTSTATRTVELNVGKRTLKLDWTLPTSQVYDSLTKNVTFVANTLTDEATDDTYGIINGDIIEFVQTSFPIKDVRTALVDGKKNVVAYKFTAQLKGECAELYSLSSDEAENEFTITPAPLTVVWDNTSFTYNASNQLPTATAGGVGSDGLISLNIQGARRNAGTGTAIASSADDNYAVKSNGTTPFTIAPYTIDVSWDKNSFVYNATAQFPRASATGLGDDGVINFVTTGEGTTVQTGYTATVGIDVSGNYEASTTTNSTTFSITKRPITLNWNHPANVTYNGTAWVYSATANNLAGSDVVSFNYTYTGTASASDAPVNAGTGYLVAAALDSANSINANYTIEGQNSLPITINKLQIKLVWNTSALTYNAQEQTVSVSTFTGLAPALISEATSDLIYSGNTNTYADDYVASVTLASDSNFIIESGETHNYTINKRPIRLTWGASSFTYDGDYHTVTATVDNPAPGHSVGDIFNYSGNSNVDADTYTASIALIDNNYEVVSGATKTYTIAKRQLTVNWALTSVRDFIYDGNAWEWEATLDNAVSGEYPSVVVSYKKGNSALGAAPTGAGTGYSAVAALDGTNDTNKNYTLTGTTKTFAVNKKTVNVVWAGLTATYDGNAHTPTASFEGVAADGTISLNSYIIGGNKTNASTYNVSIQNFTNANYELNSATTSAQFKINPMDVTIEWNTNSFVYNGSAQKPTPTVYSNGSIVSVTPTVSISSDNASTTNVGNYTARATLNNNYNITSGETQSYQITAREVTILWGQTTFSYSGSKQIPSLSVKDLGGGTLPGAIVVTATANATGAVNVGTYTATATLSNPNLVIAENKTTSFEIVPLNVTISWSPSTFVYNGGVQMPVPTIKNGSATVSTSIARATAALASGDGTTVGSHTVKATINNANLNITSGETYQYTITALSVKVNWSSTAYTYNGQAQIPTVTITATSGGKDVTALAGAHVALESGAGINAGSYKAIATLDNTNMTISGVNYKEYTISKMTVKIVWSGASFKYSGSVQMPTAQVKTTSGASVSGVSASVSLTIGNGKDAGSHTVKATLSDTTNYQISGTTGTYTYEIAKANISLSWDAAGTTPTASGAPSSAYAIEYYEGTTKLSGLPTEAGSYTVKVVIKDNNYQFTPGTTSVRDFEIED